LLGRNLKYFEKIHTDSLEHNVIKSGLKETNHPFNKIHELKMDVFGKQFRLIMSPKHKVLHSKFKAYEVDGGGKEKIFHIDRQSFYEGRVFGETSSYVKMHIDNGLLTGTIHLPDEDEIYHIELYFCAVDRGIEILDVICWSKLKYFVCLCIGTHLLGAIFPNQITVQ
ncbi:hypothetical protein WA026_010094, partial [Henosepilachna vigintioctopunctata]